MVGQLQASLLGSKTGVSAEERKVEAGEYRDYVGNELYFNSD